VCSSFTSSGSVLEVGGRRLLKRLWCTVMVY
jgi:hypothetical protein